MTFPEDVVNKIDDFLSTHDVVYAADVIVARNAILDIISSYLSAEEDDSKKYRSQLKEHYES